VTRTYRCESCGATWVNHPAGEAIEQADRCLRCDGVMFVHEAAADDPAGPRAETDTSPPVPNGLEDDAEA
jgi:hypothetical protein